MWNFGSGKTYWTFLEIYRLDSRKNYIIANVPYSKVDHYWSTTEDLLQIFEVLGKFSEESNKDTKTLFKQRKQQKNIVLIVDEAHLYLGARESLTKASILNQLKTIFTQCRKRKIRIIFITQRLTQIDIYVRRLSDYVEEYHYKNLFVLEYVKKKVYLNKWDVADIETDNSIKITNDWEAQTIKEDTLLSSELFRPLTTFFQILSYLEKAHQELIREEYKTLHICWYYDESVKPLDYDDFIEGIKVKDNKVEKKNQANYQSQGITQRKDYFPTFRKGYSRIKKQINKVIAWYEKRELKLDLEYYREELLEDELNTGKVEELEPILEQKNEAIKKILSPLKEEYEWSNDRCSIVENWGSNQTIMTRINRRTSQQTPLDHRQRGDRCPKFYTPTTRIKSL